MGGGIIISFGCGAYFFYNFYHRYGIYRVFKKSKRLQNTEYANAFAVCSSAVGPITGTGAF